MIYISVLLCIATLVHLWLSEPFGQQLTIVLVYLNIALVAYKLGELRAKYKMLKKRKINEMDSKNHLFFIKGARVITRKDSEERD